MRSVMQATGIVRSRAAPAPRAPGLRIPLLLGTALALAAGAAFAAGAPARAIDPDLARVIRWMAAIKGGFGALAFAAAWWRLARPARAWRAAAYVAGPPLMAFGAVLLWSMHGLGVGALGLHLGLLGLLAAALSDPDFIARPPPAGG
ncbi:hypothetical protein OPKNFCMD_1864 [Methylobacterium crusticola]|uniref:Uncharacterized protein n=1 Tax=Methylobacterium crusticola TaxID=1697972 RepID=A0ABQ4QW24_9HYPH|nr:hypothetical protein [Methylobacterium crusticola]GJD49134.1 hypothetical protein OPKNFCMD_1864 [Methylobacterium crusticola]